MKLFVEVFVLLSVYAGSSYAEWHKVWAEEFDGHELNSTEWYFDVSL